MHGIWEDPSLMCMHSWVLKIVKLAVSYTWLGRTNLGECEYAENWRLVQILVSCSSRSSLSPIYLVHVRSHHNNPQAVNPRSTVIFFIHQEYRHTLEHTWIFVTAVWIQQSAYPKRSALSHNTDVTSFTAMIARFAGKDMHFGCRYSFVPSMSSRTLPLQFSNCFETVTSHTAS